MATASVPRKLPSSLVDSDATTGQTPMDNGTPAGAVPQRAIEQAIRYLAACWKQRPSGGGGAYVVAGGASKQFLQHCRRNAYTDRCLVSIWISTATDNPNIQVVVTTSTGGSKTFNVKATASDTPGNAVEYTAYLDFGAGTKADAATLETVTFSVNSTAWACTVYGYSAEPLELSADTMVI